jgi:hypothetical protein
MQEYLINAFLKTGEVEGLYIGMSVSDFTEINASKGISSEPYSQDDLSIFYDYGEYDICFYNNKLDSISLKLHRNIYLLDFGKYKKQISYNTPLSGFVKYLNEVDINWAFKKVQNERDVYILTEGNVIVVYSFEEREEELVHIAKVRSF